MKIVLILFSLIIVSYMHLAFAQTDSTDGQSQVFIKTTQDGSTNVQISSNLPKENEPLNISLRFSDSNTGKEIPKVNYDIIAMQNGEMVLSQLGLYTPSGMARHITTPLSTHDQVDVIVILQGIGESAPYTGPKSETIETTIVPEFGLVASLVLIAATSLIILIHKTSLKNGYFVSS